MRVTVSEEVKDIEPGSDGFGLFSDKTIVAMRVNGEPKDLAHKLSDGDVVEAI